MLCHDTPVGVMIITVNHTNPTIITFTDIITLKYQITLEAVVLVIRFIVLSGIDHRAYTRSYNEVLTSQNTQPYR